MQLYLFFFLLFSAIYSSVSVDLTCPNSPITRQTPSGSFPSGGLTLFPGNYSCSIKFDIPDGQIIKFIVQTNAIPGYGDSIVIVDSVSTINEMDAGQNIFYSPANRSTVSILTTTSTSSFFLSWQYIDVTVFTRISNPTGTILNLNLTGNSYYSFTSTKSSVSFHTATKEKIYDLSLSRIYVFDGEDLNSNFIGTLLQFTALSETLMKSTGKSLTLVNFYGSGSRSFGIANDYSAVLGFQNYEFVILTSAHELQIHELVQNGAASAKTFFCIDSKETYITSLTLSDQHNGAESIQIRPLTPSDTYTPLLNYKLNDPISSSLPQQILTDVFTVIMYQSDVSITLTSGPLPIWSIAYPGRRGYICSSSVWNPKTPVTVPYNTNLTSTEMVTFAFNLQSVIMSNGGEKIRVEIGAPNLKPVGVEFTETAVNTGTKAANGTYMSTSFNGASVSSSFVMTFDVQSTSPVTTTAFPDTSTKSSTLTLSLPIVVMALTISLFIN